MTPRRLIPALVLAPLAACAPERIADPDAPGGSRYRVESVAAAFGFAGYASHDWLPAGDTATLRAIASSGGWTSSLIFDSHASDDDARRFAWTSSDPAVATIGPTGVVTALRPGVTRLGASVDGVRGDGPLLTVYPRAARLVVAPGAVDTEVGARPAVRVTARDDEGREVAGVPLRFHSRSYPVAGAEWRAEEVVTPAEQPLYAWRGGTTTIAVEAPHANPAARLRDSVRVTVHDPGVAPDTLPRRSRDPWLQVEVGRSTLRSGDTTTVRLILRNPTAAAVRFEGSAECFAHWQLREAGGTIAWPLGPTSACSTTTRVSIAPGDSLVRAVVWRADDGRQPATALAPGLYYVWAFAIGREGGSSIVRTEEPLRLRVLP